jgi:hypothetical protein
MTDTRQDFAMITGQPIGGKALTRLVDNEGWHNRVVVYLGINPDPTPSGDVRDPRLAGVLYTWLLRVKGRGFPLDANEATVEEDTLTQVVFLDSTGDSALWMYLGVLRNRDVKYSWGRRG